MIETGKELKEIRTNAGLKLEEVSLDLDIPVIVLEQIESGAIGSFGDIFELKKYLSDYSKYLGLDENEVILKFNEYMFDYTSKIPMADIEKAIKEKEKEKEDEVISSPYTKIVKKEKTAPYIITGIVILILVVIVLIWSIRQITVNGDNDGLIGYLTEEFYEFTK